MLLFIELNVSNQKDCVTTIERNSFDISTTFTFELINDFNLLKYNRVFTVLMTIDNSIFPPKIRVQQFERAPLNQIPLKNISIWFEVSSAKNTSANPKHNY